MTRSLPAGQDVRSGVLSARGAERKYGVCANLVQLSVTHRDGGEFDSDCIDGSSVTECEAKIAAVEPKVGRRTRSWSS